MKPTLNQIRDKFLSYMQSNDHIILKSSSLIPENDSTTLFTGSGMQPMLPYLLGEPHPSGKRLTDTQKCFRSQDIEEVGDNRHTTFFEMLGNWSLGDYFKKEQISYMYKFLIDKECGLGIDKDRLYFSCYEGNQVFDIKKDEQTREYWLNMGVDDSHISFYPDKKNWWSRAGEPKNMPAGEPGGPDTEMFYDFDPVIGYDEKGAEIHEFNFHSKSIYKDEKCHANCDCGRFMEIGNNVFMQFKKTQNGVEELKNKNVDFGGGLERMAAAVNNDPDVFNLDVFLKPKTILEQISGQKYISDINVTFNDVTSPTFAYRVILDHIRAVTFLIGDGVLPGNKEQQYFVRSLIRRAVRYAHNININVNFTKSIAESFIDYYKDSEQYLGDNLNKNKNLILEEIDQEEIKFRKTLENGMKEFEKIIKNKNNISADDAFDLFQSYGFPIELTIEMAKEKNITVDVVGFKKAKQEHSDKSRTASIGMFKGGLSDSSEITTAYHSICHLMLSGMRKVLGDTVTQSGANITSERLRFDFTLNRKIEEIEIKQIEDYVNNAILEGFETEIEQMKKDDAKNNTEINGSFWDKYPDIVNVYNFVSKNKNIDGSKKYFSRELCGGPHVENSDVYAGDNLKGKTFKIIKQEAVSAGVRRVKGVLIDL